MGNGCPGGLRAVQGGLLRPFLASRRHQGAVRSPAQRAAEDRPAGAGARRRRPRHERRS